jgi:hypothetical protein
MEALPRRRREYPPRPFQAGSYANLPGKETYRLTGSSRTSGFRRCSTMTPGTTRLLQPTRPCAWPS